MSLFDGILEADGIPAAAEPAPVIDIPCLVTIKRASNGQEIMLCTVSPPPASAIADAAKRGLALFVTAEIQAMRKIAAEDTHAIDIIIETRRVMGFGGPIEYRRTA